MLVQQYQTRVLAPNEIVRYDQIVMSSYPAYAFQTEPFVGFRVLIRDMNYNTFDPSDRLRLIDSKLGFLKGSGCLIRETKKGLMPDGFWVMTCPVPRSQVGMQINYLLAVLNTFEQMFGLVISSLFEVSISGRSTPIQFTQNLNGLMLPQRYMSMLVTQKSPFVMCPFGHIMQINDEYTIIRTRWDMSHGEAVYNVYEGLRDYLDTISLKLSTIFR